MNDQARDSSTQHIEPSFAVLKRNNNNEYNKNDDLIILYSPTVCL